MSELDDENGGLAAVRWERQDRSARADLIGEVDISNADDVLRELLSAADQGVGDLLVDLSGLRFIDSAGIAVMDRLTRALASGGTRLRIHAAEGSVAARTLALAGMDRVLPMSTGEATG